MFEKFFGNLKTPIKVIRKIINRFPTIIRNKLLYFPSEEDIKKEILNLENLYHGKSVFIFPPPSSPWGYLFQRPHQLAIEISKRGYPVLYCVDTSFSEAPDWYVRGIVTIKEHLYLYNDGNSGKYLNNIKNPIIWQYWPSQDEFLKTFNREVPVIYDCIDHISTFLSYNGIKKDHLQSLTRANIVLATADNILKSIQKIRKDCMLVPNAVRFEDFEKTKTSDTFGFNKQREKYDIIVGYYGAIAEWIDFDLIEKCARNNPKWLFVFVGEKYPNVIPPKLSNIVFLPRQSYSRLPLLLDNIDVAILPFKLNDITNNTSPVKIFEYMASGTPIVSTPLIEVVKYPEILIANNADSFQNQINKANRLKNNNSFIQSLKYRSLQNTWEKRLDLVIFELKKRGLIYD